MKTDAEVLTFADTSRLIHATAEAIVQTLNAAIQERGRASFVLTGGSTIRPVYRLLTADYRDAVDWTLVHVFWGDERHVPHDAEESNYGMARKDLLNILPIPENQIHPMPTSRSPEEDASAYEEALRTNVDDGPPGFDLLLLGMGADGHVASLFPGSPALDESERFVLATQAPVGSSVMNRITLTPPAITASRVVFFVVTGERKRAAVAAVQSGSASALPAALISARERLVWFIDVEAAGKAAE